jgi:hypothetical protein
MMTLAKLTELVNHCVNAKIEIEEISADTKIEFEVESDFDVETLSGGYYFDDLTEAYSYLKESLDIQTDPEALECDDAPAKINGVGLYLHFNSDDIETICIAYYSRKSDTEFYDRLIAMF